MKQKLGGYNTQLKPKAYEKQVECKTLLASCSELLPAVESLAFFYIKVQPPSLDPVARLLSDTRAAS